MPGPAARMITVSARQRRVLEWMIRRDSSPQQLVQRAKIVLVAAGGANNEEVGRRVGVQAQTARIWRRRWAEAVEALAAAEVEGADRALATVIVGILGDEARAGAPALFTAEQFCQIMALACLPPEQAECPIDHWTPRELAEEAMRRGIVARISPSTVGRFLKGGRSQTPSQPVLAHARAR